MEEGGVRVRGQGGRQLLAEVGAGRLQPLSSAAAKAKVAADEVVLAEAAAAAADCWNPGSWPRKQTSWSAAAEGLAAGVVVTEAGGQRGGGRLQGHRERPRGRDSRGPPTIKKIVIFGFLWFFGVFIQNNFCSRRPFLWFLGVCISTFSHKNGYRKFQLLKLSRKKFRRE